MTTITDLLHLPLCADPARMTTEQIRAAQHSRLSDHICWHFGFDRRYADNLATFCERIGARPHFGWRGDCPRRLHNRRHKCSHNIGDDRLGFNVDHPVWLRWPDGCWGLLSQTYDDRQDYDTLTGLGYTVAPLGLAPYGHGTGALLVLGADASTLAP